MIKLPSEYVKRLLIDYQILIDEVPRNEKLFHKKEKELMQELKRLYGSITDKEYQEQIIGDMR